MAAAIIGVSPALDEAPRFQLVQKGYKPTGQDA
jgi:hypothetical protein